MLVVLMSALLFQQTPQPTINWSTPVDPAVAAPAPPPPPPIPDWARADPYGYERSECSPLIRKADESMETCQVRVRAALAANLGGELPAGLRPAGTPDDCRQTAAGDRYALQCGSPTRPTAAPERLVEQTCQTRPQAQPGGGVTWEENCRPGDGRTPTREGLRIIVRD